MRRLLAFAAVVVTMAACGGSGSPGDADTPPRTAPPGGAFVVFEGGATATVELADSREEQLRGLMGRRELGADDGMLFVFPKAQHTGFWMKNTLIPLAIAYMKRSGDGMEVVAIEEMVPCRADPCPPYPPGAAYDRALEMNAGWFDAHGIEVGDTARQLTTVG